MFPRQYWGKAGGALASLAIGSALADVITRSAATDPSSVPLWPLAICLFLFTAGAVLFALRASDEQSEPTSTIIAESQLEITSTALPDIRKFFKGNTDMQARKLVEAHSGDRLAVRGRVENIKSHDTRGTAVLTFIEYANVPQIEMNFRDKKAIARLAVLTAGTKMTVTGRITHFSRVWIYLDDCEIVSVALPESKV